MQITFSSLQKGRSIWLVLFFTLFLLFSLQAESKEPSKWALGLGIGWLSDYPGAAQGRIRFLPFPVYRGSVFRIDRISGVSGEVYSNSRVNFSWNFIFQFPTDSSSIPARVGMPNLDWFFSIGPQLKYYIYRHKQHKFFFRFPVRTNTCTNFSDRTRFCGVAFNPGFRYAMRYPALGEITLRWEAFSHSSEFQQYFYEVSSQYATPTREAFHARAGFLGFVYGVLHSLPFDGWEVSTAINFYDYSLAINDESPLFVHKTNYAFFLAFTIDL